jgi:hypothetical protein
MFADILVYPAFPPQSIELSLRSPDALTHYGANLSIEDCPRAGVAQW